MDELVTVSEFTDCEQLAYNAKGELTWSLAKLNSCHIRVMNAETGKIWESIDTMNGTLSTVSTMQGVILGIMAVVGVAIVSLVVKKMWGK